MSEEIIKVLDNLGEKFGIAIDWTSQNVMPYLEDLASRYIAYKNLIALVQIVIAIVLIVAGIIFIIKLIKWKNSDTFNVSCFSEDKDNFFLRSIRKFNINSIRNMLNNRKHNRNYTKYMYARINNIKLCKNFNIESE